MIRQMIRESQGLSNDDWGISQSHTLFTDDVLYAEPPRHFRMPALPVYEGSSDPNQHVLKYEWMMNAARADDVVKCHSFPISLGGIATMWFTRLPPRSISNFDQMATKFVEQFRMHVARPKDVNTLSSLTQAPGETLRCYLE